MGDFFVKENLAGLKREDFQATVDGKQVDLFILKNKKGAEIAATNYAGALLSVMMPDKNGKMASTVMGHDSLDHVINSPEAFLSVLIGRYGNRVGNAKFTLDGKEYQLTVNDNMNSLHGGPTGFHKRVWDATQTDQQTLKLHYLSVDGEEGFPGNLDVNVTYRLTDDNEFVIEYEATTDKKTILCLTHHAFFNLSGREAGKPAKSVLGYELTMNCDYYLPIDAVAIPYGTIDAVEGTPLDFRTPHVIGDRIDQGIQLQNGQGYDHCWVINKREPGEMALAVKCKDPESGRTLEVYTTEPAVQCYTGNFCNGFECAEGSTLPRRCAICFEPEHFPDSPNKAHYPTSVLNPGEVYTQTSVYRFGVEE